MFQTFIRSDDMITNFLIKRFIPKSSSNTRQSYGYLGGFVGIFVNILLFGAKFVIGSTLNSVSIAADAFNNLTDVGSSVITIIGFKIADKPADKDHPFGHGRGEYIAGLIISFIVLLVGVEFVKSSYDRILNPVKLEFELISFIVLLISIAAKLWLGSFNKRLGREIKSEALNATSFDSFSDVIVTSTVAISLVISKFTTLPVDGYIGMLVSGFILFAGYSLIKDTISPLLGEAPPPELVKAITEEVLKYQGIIGAHDLIVHSYGANKYMATVHAEIPSSIPILDAHEIIDIAENKISKKLDISLIIHMDPVNVNDVEIQETRIEVEEILKDFPQIISYHDFRIVGTHSHKNILFDVVVNNTLALEKEKQFLELLSSRIKVKHPNYNVIINIDRDYLQL
jgi:cation diffusion facilitator family transporter